MTVEKVVLKKTFPDDMLWWGVGEDKGMADWNETKNQILRLFNANDKENKTKKIVLTAVCYA